VRRSTSFGFWILVLVLFAPCLGGSAPHSDVPADNTERAAPGDPGPDEAFLLQTTTLTPVEGRLGKMDEFIQTFDRRNYYHPYRQSLFVYLGAVVALKDSADFDDLIGYSAGFTWELPKALSPKWEVGATWTTAELGQITVGRKHIINEKSALRPFYRYGFVLKVDPDDQAAVVSNFDNYLLRAGVGLENIIRPPRSGRMDLDLAVGQDDIWIMFNYGYAWGL